MSILIPLVMTGSGCVAGADVIATRRQPLRQSMFA